MIYTVNSIEDLLEGGEGYTITTEESEGVTNITCKITSEEDKIKVLSDLAVIPSNTNIKIYGHFYAKCLEIKGKLEVHKHDEEGDETKISLYVESMKVSDHGEVTITEDAGLVIKTEIDLCDDAKFVNDGYIFPSYSSAATNKEIKICNHAEFINNTRVDYMDFYIGNGATCTNNSQFDGSKVFALSGSTYIHNNNICTPLICYNDGANLEGVGNFPAENLLLLGGDAGQVE